MKLEIVHCSAGNVARLGPQVIERAILFAETYDVLVDPQTLMANIAGQMYAQDGARWMLILAAVSTEYQDAVVGHAIVELVNNHGRTTAVVSQLQVDKDQRVGREETIRSGMGVVWTWAKSMGATKIRAWALNEKLARLYESMRGFDRKPYVLVEADVDGDGGA